MQLFDKKLCIKLLEDAEIQYKFALALNTTYSAKAENLPELSYITYFTYMKHWADEEELRLDREQEKRAAMIIEHSAVYLMAVQMDTVLQINIPDRLIHKNNDIKSGSSIIKLIRNSFAHNPFAPIWFIDHKFRNKIYTIDKIKLDTSKLNSKPVKRRDYGGPLALLWLSKWVKNLI